MRWLLFATVILSLQAAEGQRPFVFGECPALSVRVGDLPDSLKPYKDDFKATVEKRLREAGHLAQTTDLILRLRIIELPRLPRAYLVDLDLFHRMDGHRYGRGLVILWGMLAFEQYRNESATVGGLTAIADELTAAFVADYKADGCSAKKDENADVE